MTHIFRRIFIGPFQFLAISLIVSETLLGVWMLEEAENSTERIVAGSLSIAVLIAVLVVFCVIYYVKRKYDEIEVEDKMKNNNHKN